MDGRSWGTRALAALPAATLVGHLVISLPSSFVAIRERASGNESPVTTAYRALLETVDSKTSRSARVLVLTPDATNAFRHRYFLASSALFPRAVLWGAGDDTTKELHWATRVSNVAELVAREHMDVVIFDHTREDASGTLVVDATPPGVRVEVIR